MEDRSPLTARVLPCLPLTPLVCSCAVAPQNWNQIMEEVMPRLQNDDPSVYEIEKWVEVCVRACPVWLCSAALHGNWLDGMG